MGLIHRPVLVCEAMQLLRPDAGGVFVDCTLGMGGHAEALLEASTNVQVIGIDRDEEAIEFARCRLKRFGARATAVHAHFNQLAEVLGRLGISQVDGILVDLGVSSLQLESVERGFSLQSEGPLDMRMDRRQKVTAADLVNTLSESELADLIYRYGEERAARRIAKAIVCERSIRALTTTTQLADIVRRALRSKRHTRIHPATRTFQALRIAVNEELSGLGEFIGLAIEHLKPGGRMVVISFHSLEDRIIKQSFRFYSGCCQCLPPAGVAFAAHEQGCPICGAVRKIEVLTRKAIQPSEDEVKANPRARSGKLRACLRL